MKTVILRRAFQNKEVTLGMLQIKDIEHKPIYTLENPQRETSADSLIPAGLYHCEPYSGTKYKSVYKVMNVPGRTDILFHWGNWEFDTEGCILLGLGSGTMKGLPAVKNSKKAMDQLRSIIGMEPFFLKVFDPLD